MAVEGGPGHSGGAALLGIVAGASKDWMLMTNEELDAEQFQRWIAHDLHALLAQESDQKFAEIWLFAEVLESVARELKSVLNSGATDAKTIW